MNEISLNQSNFFVRSWPGDFDKSDKDDFAQSISPDQLQECEDEC